MTRKRGRTCESASILPKRMKAYSNKYEYHLLLKVPGVTEAQAFLDGYFAKASGGYFECTDEEGEKAFLHQFAAAGAAVRYRSVHTIGRAQRRPPVSREAGACRLLSEARSLQLLQSRYRANVEVRELPRGDGMTSR
jgi:hypothetical protein